MIPGMNPRQMRQAMKRMGIQQQDIDATEVIIRTPTKDIVFSNPQVAKINMMGQETYQIVGQAQEMERDTTPDISEEDIATVMEQTNCTREEAEKAIKEAKGDLAEAIMSLGQ
ncbi:nascent polypeptide-associated complex protein [Candidatus Woesearchaeota archaeon]|nr:MAG: nascent polypeptide-associated complex protein [Candidatus Woesearchaeota archaeon]